MRGTSIGFITMTSCFMIRYIILMALMFSLGSCLDCYTCSSRQDKECLDPFEGNRSEAVNCSKVRETGLGMLAAAQALGASHLGHQPLGHPPYVCYKLTGDDYVIRGCSKPELCDNYTSSCEICDTDACNAASINSNHFLEIAIYTVAYSILCLSTS